MGTIIDSETGEVLSMTMPYADLLPPLSTVEKEALRASIELEGVRDPVAVDELGRVLDGHHRLAIAPDAPVRVISGLTEAEKVAYVYRTNFTRRNLSSDQKKDIQRHMKAIAKSLRKEGKKLVEIAALLGAPLSTIHDWLGNNTSISGSGNASTPDGRANCPPRC